MDRVFDYEALFQKPYFYEAPSFAIHPSLAAEISAIQCLSHYPCYRYETLMTEPPADFGDGLVETGRNYGFGASFTHASDALTKSIFEAWERKSAKLFNLANLVQGTFNQLQDHAVSPEGFGLVSDWEREQSPLPYLPYHHDLTLSWVRCGKVADRSLQPALIPATLVYSRFSWKHPGERFVPNLSPGQAWPAIPHIATPA